MSQVSAPPAEARPSYGTGVAVVLLYIFFVLAVFAGFASYLTRTELQSQLQTSNSEVQALDDLIYLLRREEILRVQIEETLSAVDEADLIIDDAKRRLEELLFAKRRQSGSLVRLASETFGHFNTGMPHWDSRSGIQVRDVIDADLNAESKLRALLDIAPGLLPSQEADIAALELVLARIGTAQSRLTEVDDKLAELRLAEIDLQSDRDRALESRSWPQRQREQLEKELTALRVRLPADSSGRARVSALSSALIGGLFLKLVSFPTIFLTLIVTMAAGGLGTVVSYTRNLQTRERSQTPGPAGSVKFSRLFVNVGEGIAAAIAIFLLAGAGMLVLTQGSGPQNQIELSPYTVAFIAFLSGFMAEHAFTRIQEAGKRIFSVPKGDKDQSIAIEKPVAQAAPQPTPAQPAAAVAPGAVSENASTTLVPDPGNST
ncbi:MULTISPECIES: hypothetical protein [unclassified Marinovum]